jgi:NAD(P)-dependent dehydrogenase (short-subunit alcohol dehydrogenase family)
MRPTCPTPAPCGAAVARLGEHAGRIDVLHFNVVAFRAARVKELTAADLLDDLAVGAASLLTAVDAARPLMSAAVVLATGSVTADRPMPSAVSLGVQKAALRNWCCLDRDLRRDGIRAASVTVRGTIAAGTPFDPDRIAEVFVQLSANAANAGDEWRTEVPYTG